MDRPHYDLDRAVYVRARDTLIDRFGLGPFLDVPVRKLSLGQRMRAEIAASLLHAPKVLFLFFTRFPVLRGWDVRDVITIWALAAAGFGLAHAIYGNALHLANLIAQGQLDVWMLYPRALLPHLLLGRMSATAWGDALFGYVVYVALVRPDLAHLALFVALSLAAAALFVGFSVLSGSLGFFLGNSATLTEQWRMAMITLSTYPATLFGGTVKLLLYTLVPAAFVTYLPIVALRDLSLAHATLAAAGSFGFLLLSAGVFYRGLRRYESGNLLAMRE